MLRAVRVDLQKLRRQVAEAVGSDRYSHLALNSLDRKLARYLDFRDGFFVEAGANDGLRQSNTYWFERFRGWRGVLIEGVAELARACRANRPRATVVEAALVGDDSIDHVTMKTANLMSIVAGAFGSVEADAAHVRTGAEVQRLAARDVRDVRVRARTLTSVLADVRPARFDLLSLDVEGYEREVLRGLDLTRFAPRYILVETRELAAIDAQLAGSYERVDQLSHHDYLYAVKR
jgi:FkbM family methyltransferase